MKMEIIGRYNYTCLSFYSNNKNMITNQTEIMQILKINIYFFVIKCSV